MEEAEIPETYELTSLEQLRTLADELRMRAMDALTYKPMTVTQLGEFLGEAPAKMHYHVRELERVGLVKLVATREKSGILEKYYRAVAKSFRTTDMLLRTQTSDEVLAPVRAFLESNVESFVRATAATIRAHPGELLEGMGGASSMTLWVTPEEEKQFLKELVGLLNRYSTPRGIEGEQEHTFLWLSYDPRLAASTAPAASPKSETAPRTVLSVVVGAFTYSRKYLELVVERGERLDLNVIGTCSFADNIPPELVENAIARFRQRGPLHASDAVREVLKQKAPPSKR